MSIQSLRNKLEQQKGQRSQIKKSLSNTVAEIKKNKQSLKDYEEAREIIRAVGLMTQQQLQYHISDITSLALESVFKNPYELSVEFIQRRNKTECDLFFVRGGNRINPLEASGVGAVDVAAFALRVAAWSMSVPHSRNVLILDEPFKHLKGEEENLKVLDMIKEISKRLGLQIIMISDERIDREDTVAATDQLFEVKIRKGRSKVIQS